MRGSVFTLRPPSTARGHEQQGQRFGIVVQSARFEHLGTWLVVPTSASARPTIFRPVVVVPGHGPSRALCEGTSAVDPQRRLGKDIGHLSHAELSAVDDALRLLMDLDLIVT